MKYAFFIFSLFSFSLYANTASFYDVDLNNDDEMTKMDVGDCRNFYQHDFYNKGAALYNFNETYKQNYPDLITYIESLYLECSLYVNNTIKTAFNSQLKNPVIEGNTFYFNPNVILKFTDIQLISRITTVDFNKDYSKRFQGELKDKQVYTYIEIKLNNGTQFKIYFERMEKAKLFLNLYLNTG